MENLIERPPRRVHRELSVDLIQAAENDLRADIDENALHELASTMNVFGTLQPITVSYKSQTRQYSLLIGGQRLRAAKLAHLATIPAYVIDDVGDQDALVMMLIENMQRTDLSPLDEARGMAELRDRFGYSDQRIAATLSKRLDFVQNRLELLKLPDPIREHIAKGRLGVVAALHIAQTNGSEKKKVSIANAAVEQGLTGDVVKRVVEEEATSRNVPAKTTPPKKPKAEKPHEQLSAEEVRAALQRITLQGEKLLSILEDIQTRRLDDNGKNQLREVTQAIEEGLRRYRERWLRQSDR